MKKILLTLSLLTALPAFSQVLNQQPQDTKIQFIQDVIPPTEAMPKTQKYQAGGNSPSQHQNKPARTNQQIIYQAGGEAQPTQNFQQGGVVYSYSSVCENIAIKISDNLKIIDNSAVDLDTQEVAAEKISAYAKTYEVMKCDGAQLQNVVKQGYPVNTR
jgi:hypothetical protein